MEHPTEYALEQFVLDAPEVRLHGPEIAAHLETCPTCSNLAAEIREFYTVTARRTELNVRTAGASSRSLTLRRGPPRRPRYPTLDAIVLPGPATFSEKLESIIRVHPVASTVSFIGSVVAALVVGILISRPSLDREPSYTTLNLREGIVSVYNARHQVIFSAPWQRLVPEAVTPQDLETLQREILVVRCQGRSENVLVSSLPFGKRSRERAPRDVRFLSGSGDELSSLPIPSGRIRFRARPYDTPMEAREILVSAMSPYGATELVAHYDAGRSPNVMQRADVHGNILGEYWHFGALVPDTVDFDSDGRLEMIACGVNDLDDYRRFGDPVVALIDPRLIAGVSESSASRGFGFPASVAERYYLALPFPDAALLAGKRIIARSARRLPNGTLEVFVSGDPPDFGGQTARTIAYTAILDTAMNVLQIKPNDALIDLHRKLYDEKTLREPLSDAYFRALAARTRYWNGQSWTATVARVRHEAPASRSH